MRYMFVCVSSEAKSVHPMLKPYLWGTSHLFAPAECFLVSFPRNLRSASLIEYHNFLLLNSPFRGFPFPLSFRYLFLHKNQHKQSFLLILCADFHCSLLTKWHWHGARGFFVSPIEKTRAKETQRKELYEQQRKPSRIDSVFGSEEAETPVYALGNSRWNYPRNGAADSEAIMCFQGEKHNHHCPV